MKTRSGTTVASRLQAFAAISFAALSLAACSDDERPADAANDSAATETTSEVSDALDDVDATDNDSDVAAEINVEIDSEIDGEIDVGPPDPGALVRVSVNTQVAYLLDDLPVDLRAAVADELAAKPDAFWIARAEMHLTATRFRLGYRRLLTFLQKGLLALPPQAVRTITLDPAGPTRTTIDGHDVVAISYTMTGTLLSDIASLIVAEPALETIGAVWVEPFVMPADPDLLMQRTGFACIRELVETSELLDADNALHFFDDGCTADGLSPIGCHKAPLALSCVDAMRATTGTVEFGLTYERLPWDSALADAVRIPLRSEGAPDLRVLPSGLENHQILYSYIPPDACSLVERCVGGSGWRRLLRFDASLENVGSEDLTIGPLADSPFLTHNVFEYSACHEHYHFRFYGDFTLEDESGDVGIGDKRAFCLLSTSRYANEERVPVTHDHDFCNNQGIVRGWGDDYYAGLDCQWIDITDLPIDGESETLTMRFDANPVGFLCEGTPHTDEAGEQLFSTTEYVSESGQPIDRPECTFVDGYADNNHGAAPVIVPSRGGLVTLPCKRGQLGPRRDCGFTEVAEIKTCTPGERVTVTCEMDDPTAGQVVRICETSAVLETPIACTYRESLASSIVRGADPTMSFTCPAARGVSEPGGTYAFYRAPILDGDALQSLRCEPTP